MAAARFTLNSVRNFLGTLLIPKRTVQIMSASRVGAEEQPTSPPPGLLKVLECNPKRLKRIKFLGELFKANGFELRIAGGAVRDIIRGKEPKDIDFATTARPEQSLEIVKKHEDLLRIIVTTAGQRHGTVAVKFKETEIDFKRIKLSHNHQDSQQSTVTAQEQVKAKKQAEPEYDDESPYEITTLRCDKLTDGRHAEVEFINDWHKDAERRDLTINAMFLTLDDGRLIDYFGGESDLMEGVVRFVGDADTRVKEDYLRILRFFRFWSRYGRGRRPDEATIQVLRDNLAGLSQISGERIWQEIKKTLSHLPCHDVFELMLNLRVFDYAGLHDENLKDYDEYTKKVLDEVKVVEDNIQRYYREILEPKSRSNPQDQTIKRLEEFIPVMLFAAAVQTDTLCLNAYSRVKFSNLERDFILYIIENRNKSVPLDSFKFQLAMSAVPERPATFRRMLAYLISKGLFEFIDALKEWKVPKFPIGGKIVAELVKERKLPPVKTKEILESVKFKWATDGYNSDEAKLKLWIEEELDRVAVSTSGR
uniref:CCA tRNA nucleotidyltransferase 1, mitochondrial n=2 Tax=Aceria tosichella TaxID=561515 RepID=A0A6G1SA78_9ACAR